MKRLVLAIAVACIGILGVSAATTTAYPPTTPASSVSPPTIPESSVSPPTVPESTVSPATTTPSGTLPQTGSQGLGTTAMIAILALAAGLTMLVVARVRSKPAT